jgi:hypothetical protein
MVSGRRVVTVTAVAVADSCECSQWRSMCLDPQTVIRCVSHGRQPTTRARLTRCLGRMLAPADRPAAGGLQSQRLPHSLMFRSVFTAM